SPLFVDESRESTGKGDMQSMLPDGIQDKLIDIGTAVLRTGALDLKTKALIAMATATATACSHCHGQFRATAASFGATAKEIDEADQLAVRMRQSCSNESGLYLISRADVDGEVE
ncbi:MAG: carboxymuconolactone decarboxylase family protein, partial [Spirochaetales bacterium]|nr:carboxymuconolactone decarboxylase family protein [Spirochaetales bacterium]